MNKSLIVLIIVCCALFTQGYAQKNTIKLLAVNDGTKKGMVVDLDLDIVDGSNRVFIETHPLSNIDTQISLRLAKTIACKTADVYCLNKDFFYSIRANSPVIAGPSAGAAMTVMT